jgi:hypothetical protein
MVGERLQRMEQCGASDAAAFGSLSPAFARRPEFLRFEPDPAQFEHDVRLACQCEKVCLTGIVPNPSDYLAAADVFLLTFREDHIRSCVWKHPAEADHLFRGCRVG